MAIEKPRSRRSWSILPTRSSAARSYAVQDVHARYDGWMPMNAMIVPGNGAALEW